MNSSRAEIKAPTQQERTSILAAVRKCILKRHFNVGGADYDEWARRFDDRADSLLTGSVDEFEEGIRAVLAELRSSHTVFYHERTNRLLPQHSIGATLRAFAHAGVQRWHFLDVFEGGLAELAGIKRGDTLLSVDGINMCRPPCLLSESTRHTGSPCPTPKTKISERSKSRYRFAKGHPNVLP